MYDFITHFNIEDQYHHPPVWSVQWNPNGDALACAADDKGARVVDVKTGKDRCVGVTPDGSKFYIFN